MEMKDGIPTVTIPHYTERLLAATGVAVISAGTAFVAYFDPTKTQFLPVCPVYSITGFACPGCGLTRGFHALFHGDVMAAIDFNALVPVWGVAFGWVFVSLLLLAIRGKGLWMWPAKPVFLLGFMFVLLTFGVLRNIPAWPFTILFP